jgi:pSer/pThr/pTyr-binding forkhead associated (FHA) protein
VPASITFDQPRIVLGRGDSCDLRLPDLSVSHRHASLRQRGAEYIVVDEGSTNGTFLGSVRLHAQSPRMVRSGDLIRLGRVWLEVRIEQIAATAQPAQATRELALALVAQALEDQGESARPRLLVTEGPDQGKHLDLSENLHPMVLGRGRQADLPIDVADASRRHAQVIRRGDCLLVRDLGSRVGTHTDAGPVPVDRDATLHAGEGFTIGPDRFVFEFPAIQALKELERESDEPLDPSAQVAPPGELPDASPAPPPDAPASEGPPATDEIFPSAPAPAISRPARRAASAAPGWSHTDVAIGLLALVVLALSAVGLVWLFRGH